MFKFGSSSSELESLGDFELREFDVFEPAEEENALGLRLNSAQLPTSLLNFQPVTPFPDLKSTTRRTERNSARVKNGMRKSPRTIVVEVKINGQAARALLDSGTMAGLVSTKLVDQLRLRTKVLEKPIPLQLAVTVSKSNNSVEVKFKYQTIKTRRTFDVLNLDGYEVILGTPSWF